MENPPLNQLEIDDLQDIGKYMFSIANGNHILRYSEKEYRDYLMQNPAVICQMLVIYHAASNWGYEDSRMFENYDEQWLASTIDIEFSSNLDFGLDDFSYEKLLPYQKAVIDFTYAIIPVIEDWSHWLKGGSLLESVYAVFANNLSLNTADGVVLNKEHAINRGIEMIRCVLNDKYKPEVPFEKWELIIY
jgi:hypothetical protein